MKPADNAPTIREQREALQWFIQQSNIGEKLLAMLRAVDLTLAKVERGELVPRRGLTQEQIDDIGIPHFPSDYDRP